MNEWWNFIETDTAVLNGKPKVKGTRLSVEFLLGLLAAGWTEQQLLENYPTLTYEGMRAVFAFLAESLKDDFVFAMPQVA